MVDCSLVTVSGGGHLSVGTEGDELTGKLGGPIARPDRSAGCRKRCSYLSAPALSGAAELSVEGLTVNFGGLSVLDDVSFSAHTGEIVGVIGPNGAGKTTLFNAIFGFVRPASGRIVWKGRELRHQRPHHLAAVGISRTLQGVGLFPGLSVLENVLVGETPSVRAGLFSSMLGLRRSSKDERRLRNHAVQFLPRLSVAEYAARMPGTLPYPVQKRSRSPADWWQIRRSF